MIRPPLVYCMKMKSTCWPLSISMQFPLKHSIIYRIKIFHSSTFQKRKTRTQHRLLLRISQLTELLNRYIYPQDPRSKIHHTYIFTWINTHRLWSILHQISLSALLVCELKKIHRYASIYRILHILYIFKKKKFKYTYPWSFQYFIFFFW